MEKLVAALDKIGRRSANLAIRNSMNTAAFRLQTDWRSNMRNSLTLRNNYAVSRVTVQKVATWKIGDMRATVGSTAPFAAHLELGETQNAKGKHGVPVSMGYAAGHSGVKTKKPVQGKHRLSAIKFASPGTPKNKSSGNERKQRNAVAMRLALKQGKQSFAFLEGKGGQKGIFKVLRRGKPKMIWNLSNASVAMRPHPTLKPAVDVAARRFPAQMAREIRLQMIRAYKEAGLQMGMGGR